MTPKEFERLQEKVTKLKKTQERLRGRREEVRERLRELGFGSKREAQARWELLNKRVTKQLAELEHDIERFEENWEKAVSATGRNE